MRNIGLDILYFWIRLREKLFEHFMIFRVVETNVGYKFVNDSLIRTESSNNVIEPSVIIDPNNLFLGIDFLKDRYTLLGCRINETPHFELMKVMLNDGDINRSDYIKRIKRGTLDARFLYRRIEKSYYQNYFSNRKREIEADDVTPILVYRVNNRYFIKDGKHRAALCALLNKPIHATVIDNSSIFGNLGKQIIERMKSEKNYSKHLSYYIEVAGNK